MTEIGDQRSEVGTQKSEVRDNFSIAICGVASRAHEVEEDGGKSEKDAQ